MSNICLYLYKPQEYVNNQISAGPSHNQASAHMQASSYWAKVAIIMAIATVVFGTLLAISILALPAIVATLGGITLVCALMAMRGYYLASQKMQQLTLSDTPQNLTTDTSQNLTATSVPLANSTEVPVAHPNMHATVPHHPEPTPPPMPEACAALIQNFWQQHIHSFKMKHCTTSLYQKHFQTHGVSALYPPQLAEVIAQIRKIWSEHQDIYPISPHFTKFLQHYDQAIHSQQIHLDCTTDQDKVNRFTNKCPGGLWMKKLRHFIYKAQKQLHQFSQAEQRTIIKVGELMYLMNVFPMMTVGIPYDQSPGYGTLNYFKCYVISKCNNWQDPIQLAAFLEQLLKQVTADKLSMTSNITISHAVAASDLEIELLPSKYCNSAEQPEPSALYPHLEFDVPRVLTMAELSSLKLHSNGFSTHPEYTDSRFKWDDLDPDPHFRVTRQALTAEDKVAKEQFLFEIASRKEWIAAFECESIIQQYHLDLFA